MREYLFHGKRVDNGEWVEGHYYTQVYHEGTIEEEWYHFIKPIGSQSWEYFRVEPWSVGQYTGMKEFVVSDRSFNKPLFEGDIVEVWGMRCPKYTLNPKSQYDGWTKVRAVACFQSGEWTLDYENKYNEKLTKLKGKEEDIREIAGEWSLYRHQYHGKDEDWYREHNTHYKWHDIVKIGNVFENKDLLEG